MKKPTLYFDTSIISAYWYEGADVAMIARRMHTREWWDAERKHFSLWASAFGEAELRAGRVSQAARMPENDSKIALPTYHQRGHGAIDELLERGLVPETKPGDAAHLAISTSHGIDYLLTWNYAHMANANVQTRLDLLCEELELVAPLMVSPESIPQDRFGQAIQRRE